MKLFSKIAILAALIAFVSSCQKEEIPSPAGYSSQPGNTTTQRAGSTNNTDQPGTVLQGNPTQTGTDNIVDGGDDDKDGGGNGRHFNPGDLSDSTSTHMNGQNSSDNTGTGDIVSGGDDDKDGGGSTDSGKKKGG